jgi:hypothetical protein
MPHLAHSRVPVASRSPSPLPSPVTPRPGLHREQPSGHTINREAWPTFPTGQSLSDDTAQLHLTLRGLPPSHSSSSASTPLLSRQPSSSGSATGTPDSDKPASAAVIQSFDPGNECLTQPPEAYLTTKNRSKKNNRVSASSLASLLSTNPPEDKGERKERKRMEKLMRHEQALQELRTAERRRAYFRDVSHRQELVFGPEVRVFPHSIIPLYPKFFRTWVVDLCAPLGHIHDRLLLRLYSVHADVVVTTARRHLVRPDALLGRSACPLRML